MTRSNLVNETRKLVRWGSSNTLIVSLPRKWTKRYNLSDHDEVHVSENADGSLVIRLQEISKEEDSKTTINADKLRSPFAISQVLLSKYLDGYCNIIIQKKMGFSPGEIAHITEIADNLLGFEIVRKTPAEIALKDIMSIRESNIPLLIKILTRQTNELYSNFVEIVNGGKKEAGQAGIILQSQKSIERYYYRINRQLRKAFLQPSRMTEMNLTSQDAADYAFYISYIFEASTSIAGGARAIIKHGYIDPPSSMSKFLIECKDYFVSATRSLLFKQAEKAFYILENIDDLVRDKRKIENQLDNLSQKKPAISLQIILDNVERTLDVAKNIAITTIRRNL
ncbi:MAG: AbrB/MazE/SpoVT family DNA-binding domain-containing protein [Candidatus Ranarchaeia archaeon]